MTDTIFNAAADNIYGSYCCICFVIGTFGNIISFLYFKSKKRDIASVVYMCLTVADVVVSFSMFPKGLSYLSGRQPGIIFGSKYGCEVYYHLCNVTLHFSVFLTICLSVSRTISLIDPFRRLRVKYLVIAVSTFYLVTLTESIAFNMAYVVKMHYNALYVSCLLTLHTVPWTFICVSNAIYFLIPVFVVAISCTISLVILTRRNRNVKQKELQLSRNRATVTILLFALLYELCNLPMVAYKTITIIHFLTGKCSSLFEVDEKQYLHNGVMLLCVGNSAVNPILYFWRMPPLKDRTVKFFRRILVRVNRGLPDFSRIVLRIDRENQKPRNDNLRVIKSFRDVASPVLGRDRIETCSSTAVETGNL